MMIASAGNTLAPAWLALLSLGYAVSRVAQDGALLRAVRGDVELVADDPLQLLGLATLLDVRGEDWAADDVQIEEYLSRFESGSPAG